MQFRTSIEISQFLPFITYDSKILSLGSCFSEHIANKLSNSKYQVLRNPFGITFNPISTLSCIKSCIKANSLPEESLIQEGDLWVHHDFHSSFSHHDKQIALENMNTQVLSTHNYLPEVDVVFLTVGTSWVHELDGQIVNNCHKRPQQLFNKRLLSTDEIFEALSGCIQLLGENTSKDPIFIFTLSPVRHIKEGLANNQLSKANALVAIHQLCKENHNAIYFPAYEILIDDLRDYRYYKDDLIHPSDMAIKYVFHCFEAAHLDPEEKPIREEIAKVMKAISHRVIHASSTSHEKFVKKTHR